MSQKYFENIRSNAAKVEEGIARLEETWRLPHLMFIKGDELEPCEGSRKILENIKNEILSIKEAMAKDREEIETIKEMNRIFNEETKASFEDLKQQLEEIKMVFQEFGYEDEEELLEGSSVTDDENQENQINLSNSCNLENSMQSENMLEKSLDNPVVINKVLKEINQEPMMNAHFSPQFYKIIKKV